MKPLDSIEAILSNLDMSNAAVRNNGGGFYNHSLFWSVMNPNDKGTLSGELKVAIEAAFGSEEAFMDAFSKAAATQFGSGWAWLCVHKDGKVSVCSTPNQDNTLMPGVGCGGTPILDYAKNSLSGEKIISFAGILNGTTNYILSNMTTGLTFEEALKDAKDKGYVEADEALDLDGLDAAAKLVILANWIMGMKVTMPDIKCVGIRKVTIEDIKKAEKNNSVLKLIASCDKELVVSPKEIPKDDPLGVNGTLNAIAFTSEHSGTQTIIGKGAGGTETASSILRDLLDIRQEIAKN